MNELTTHQWLNQWVPNEWQTPRTSWKESSLFTWLAICWNRFEFRVERAFVITGSTASNADAAEAPKPFRPIGTACWQCRRALPGEMRLLAIT